MKKGNIGRGRNVFKQGFPDLRMDKKEAFFKVYSNVPIEERSNVVVVINKQPISWALAYQEIKNDTSTGQKILKILEELGII